MIKEAFTTDLFPTEQKVRLSENSASWPETINSILIRNFPELTSYLDKIVFQHVEKLKGDAIGYVTTVNNNFRIPFVITKFTLSPLDVYIKGSVFGPLCKDSIKKLIANSWPFKQVGKSEFIQMKKFAGVSCVDMKAEDIEKNPELVKIAEEVAQACPGVIVSLDAQLKNNTIIKNAGLDPYGVEKIAALEVDPSRTSIVLQHFGKPDEMLSLGEAAARFGEEKVASVMYHSYLTIPLRSVMYKSAEEVNPNQFKFDKDLPRTVGMSDGIGGYVRGNIYELRDIMSPNNKKGHIFLSTRSKAPVYTTIFATPAPDRIFAVPDRSNILGDMVDDLSRPSASKGKAIGIMLSDIVYGPFEVTTEAVNGNERILVIKDGYEYDTHRIHITNDVKNINVVDDDVYVPKYATLIYLGEPYQVEHPLHKTAAITVTIASSPDKKTLNVSDNGVSGLPATSLQNIGKTRAITALMHCGLTQDEAKAAVDKAITSGAYKFSATPTATQDESTTRKEVADVTDKKKLEKTAATIQSIVDKTQLIKIALSLGDEESVDIALGLKLVTPTSIKKYRILIPKLEDTLDGLCKLVMAKRVGGNVLPLEEGKITTAITALHDILIELTGI